MMVHTFFLPFFTAAKDEKYFSEIRVKRIRVNRGVGVHTFQSMGYATPWDSILMITIHQADLILFYFILEIKPCGFESRTRDVCS